MIDTNLFKERTVAFYTLGCKLNFSETSTIARSLSQEGFKRVDYSKKADVYIINTCSVTEVADKKCKHAIKKAINANPDGFIVVTGCFAQLKPESIVSIPGVDMVLGSNEKFKMSEYLTNINKRNKGEIHRGRVSSGIKFHPSYSFGDRTRCFLKVQDGCDYYCSYCTIPLARGHSRNDSINNTVIQAKQAISDGAKEIILTGVNIGDFGKTTGESFFDLVKVMESELDIDRIRISSIEPNLLTDEIIEFVSKSKKFLPHFHIPLQSGSDKILGIMKRRYRTDLFRQRVEKIKSVMPHAFIGVDVITGVRGETEEDFNNTLEFIKSIDISQLHVFTYSERPNTGALKITEVVPIVERKHRSHILHELSDKITRNFYAQFSNTKHKVLFESSNSDGYIYGFSENYLKIGIAYNENLINTVKTVKVTEISNDGLSLKAMVVE